MKRFLVCAAVAAAVAVALAGCAKNLELSPGGQKVQVQDELISPDNCKLVTTLRVSAQSSVRAFGSSQEHAQRDIVITARNTAAEQGANVIVPLDTAKEQVQRFEAYLCK